MSVFFSSSSIHKLIKRETFFSIIAGTSTASTASSATPGSTGTAESSVSQSNQNGGITSSESPSSFETGTTAVASGSASTPAASGSASTAFTSETGSSASSGAGSSSAPSSLSTSLGSSTPAVTGTTTKQCEEMQAVDEAVSNKITVTPNDLPQGANLDFQPTSKQGVSFPQNDTTPTITVHLGKPAIVQSVTIPRNTTPNANVEQFEVTFYSPDGKKVNDQPILSNTSPKHDKHTPAGLDASQLPSNTPVSRIGITVLQTTDGQSPKGVVLDIQACTEAKAG